MERAIKLWNGLPREMVNISRDGDTKKHLDVTVGAMVWLTRWCLVKG